MAVRTLLAALAVLACLGGPAPAEVPGQADPRFRAAVAAWLADDEAQALPAMAVLAAEGSDAARVLLALIDTRPETHGPWLAALPRARRVALLRQPGGLSGRSWIGAAAGPLAGLWRDRWRGDTAPATALAFAARGEHRAARETLLAIAARQQRGFGRLAEDPDYPPGLRYLAWGEWAATPAGRARAGAEIAGLPPGDPQIAVFTGRTAEPAARDAWLAGDPLAAPLRAFCEATCPEAAAGCARAAFELVGGLHGLARAGTPSETLIPAAAWDASPRGRAAILRRAEARDWNAGPLLQERIAGIDACTAAALERETARFLP